MGNCEPITERGIPGVYVCEYEDEYGWSCGERATHVEYFGDMPFRVCCEHASCVACLGTGDGKPIRLWRFAFTPVCATCNGSGRMHDWPLGKR